MDAYRVIRHPGDEDEGARWTCRARQQRGPVEIASGPASAVLRLGRKWLFASTGEGNFLLLPTFRKLQSIYIMLYDPQDFLGSLLIRFVHQKHSFYLIILILYALRRVLRVFY